MLKAIIDYMQTPSDEDQGLGYGITLISLYLVVDLIAKCLSQQGNFIQGILGGRAYTGVVCIIYNKILK